MKLACVVHRYGTDIAGGSEAHCRQVAEHLAARHEVTVLTSCARDHITWRNEWPEGRSTVGPVTVRRFAASRQRSLHRFASATELAFSGTATEAEQEAWFAENGPHLPGLLDHLRQHGADYDAILFWAFRYAEVWQGLPLVAERAILVPTAEDDPLMRVEVVGRFFARPAGCVYLTPEEQTLVECRVDGPPPPSCIIGAGLDPVTELPASDDTLDAALAARGVRTPYLLYLGRIDPNKGCADLLRHFLRFRAEAPGRHVQLVMAGPASMPVPAHPDVLPLGFVDEPTRAALLAGTRALMMPSRYESLSMVLLEAWNHARPAIVNAHCDVLRGQAIRANGALYYRNYDEFAVVTARMLDDAPLATTLGQQGQAYVEREYRWPRVVATLEALLATVTARGSRRQPVAPTAG